MAPAALLVPLVLVSLALFLLRPGWSRETATSTPTLQVEVATATSQPVPSSTPEWAPTSAPTPAPTYEFDDHLASAEALIWQSQFEQAITLFEELADKSPDDARPQVSWARALLLDGQPGQALNHARLALTLEPSSTEAAVALARAYVGVGDKTKGLSAAEAALRLDAQSAEVHAVLAEAFLLDGQFHRAIEEANQAVTLDPKSLAAHSVRGRLYETVDYDLEAAIDEYRIVSDLQPRLWLSHYDLGLALLKAENYDAAIEALTEAWVLRRTLVTYGALGQAYYRLGRYDEAASYLEQSLTAGAWNADTYALLASIKARQDRCEDASVYVNHALALDPNNPLALGAVDACRQDTVVQAPTPTSLPPAQGTAQPPAQETPQPPAQETPQPSATPPVLWGRIVFPVWNADTASYDTYLANADGTARSLVVEGMHQPAFSPDGQWIAVNGERHEHQNLFVVHPNGSDLIEITEHVEDGLPSWSPVALQGGTDEMSLAFSSTRHGDKQSRIYVLDRVPFFGQTDEARALNFGPDDVRGEYPTWTADSGQASIVYSGCYYDGISAQCGLMRMSAEPGPQIPSPLTSDPEDTAPATHGSQIAFMSNRDGNWEIYVVNDDGSGLRRLTHNESNDGLPTWSPDGQTIAFVSDQDGVWAVWTVNPDGSGRQKLFNIGGSGLIFDWKHERIDWGP